MTESGSFTWQYAASAIAFAASLIVLAVLAWAWASRREIEAWLDRQIARKAERARQAWLRDQWLRDFADERRAS